MDINTGTIIIKTSGKRHYRHYVTRVQTFGSRDYYWAKRIRVSDNMIKGNESIVCTSEELIKRSHRFKVEAST